MEEDTSAEGEAQSAIVSERLARLVFVGGAPRSGTTLVQRILNSHPDIFGGPELQVVPNLATMYQRTCDWFLSAGNGDFLSLDEATRLFRQLLLSLLWPKLESEGTRLLSEKTPGNALHFPWLGKVAPEARKILVVRDPRDAVASLLRVGRRLHTQTGRPAVVARDVMAAVSIVNRYLQKGLDYAESDPGCMVVYYEDVLSDPLEAANSLFRHLGVSDVAELHLGPAPITRDLDGYWASFVTPATLSDRVEKDRGGGARAYLSRPESDYVAAKILHHRRLDERYALPPARVTLSARWCEMDSRLRRIKESVPSFVQRLRSPE